MRVVVAGADLLSPFGAGVDAAWEGTCSGATAVAPIERFDTSRFSSTLGALVPDLKPEGGESLVFTMLRQLEARQGVEIPSDADLYLATTTGEIDYLERGVLAKDVESGAQSLPTRLRDATRATFGLEGRAYVVSSACASAGTAIALAERAIRAGRSSAALVLACDAVTEFVYAGFSSLSALSEAPARPFDAARDGLSVGEGAGYLLLMSEARAAAEGRKVEAIVRGSGMSNDANHMTGPSRTGEGLQRAIRNSLKTSALDADAIGLICAHGTGTNYNDAMEMHAFREIFDRPRPLFSIKGAVGHSMAAAGMSEAILSLRCLQDKQALPTANLQDADPLAEGWVSAEAVACDTNFVISTSSGFGGVNAALVLERAEAGA